MESIVIKKSVNEAEALQFMKDLYAKMSESIEMPLDCPVKANMAQIIAEMEKVGVGAWLNARH